MSTSNNNNSIASISAKLRCNPGCEALEHELMSARLERSIELGLNVSPEDAELLYSYTWCLQNDGYAQTAMPCPEGMGNINPKKNSFKTTLNRLVLARMLNCNVWDIPTDIHADHINEELGLANCRRENIQPLTKTQNLKKQASRRKGAA